MMYLIKTSTSISLPNFTDKLNNYKILIIMPISNRHVSIKYI